MIVQQYDRQQLAADAMVDQILGSLPNQGFVKRQPKRLPTVIKILHQLSISEPCFRYRCTFQLNGRVMDWDVDYTMRHGDYVAARLFTTEPSGLTGYSREQLNSTISKYKHLGQLVVLGDCNARVGGREGPRCGGCGAEKPNTNWEMLTDIAPRWNLWGYILIDLGVDARSTQTWVDESSDAGCARRDHRPTALASTINSAMPLGPRTRKAFTTTTMPGDKPRQNHHEDHP